MSVAALNPISESFCTNVKPLLSHENLSADVSVNHEYGATRSSGDDDTQPSLVIDESASDSDGVELIKKKKKSPLGKKRTVIMDDDDDDDDDNGEAEQSNCGDAERKLDNGSEVAAFSEDESEVLMEDEKPQKNSRLKLMDSDEENSGDEMVIRSAEQNIRATSDRRKDRKERILELIAKAREKKLVDDGNAEDMEEDRGGLFTDSELFSQGDSDADDEHEEMEVEEREEEEMPMRKSKKSPAQKVKRPSKHEVNDVKSEQQRMLREQEFKIPYHVPVARPIQDFLTRVAPLPTKPKRRSIDEYSENITEEKPPEAVEKPEAVLLRSVFANIPTLKRPAGDLVFEIDEEEKPERTSGMDVFMKRFEKHTARAKESTEVEQKNNVVNIEQISSPLVDSTPGVSRLLLKKHLKDRINEQRKQEHEEQERQRRYYETERYSEEEEEECEETDEDEEEEDGAHDNGGVNGRGDDDGGENVEVMEAEEQDDEESDDEELSKWNAEDARRQLEESMIEEDRADEMKLIDPGEASRPTSCDLFSNGRTSCDLFSNAATDELTNSTTENKLSDVDEHEEWDCGSSTVSSILHPGQGDPLDVRTEPAIETPFSKLLKGGLFDSASKSSRTDVTKTHMSTVILPFENTQDLYLEEEPKEVAADFVDDSETQNFLIGLDENAQFDNILNSQGFLQMSRRGSRSTNAKNLFPADGMDPSQEMSMSRVLGLCSGNFNTQMLTSGVTNEGGDGTSTGGYCNEPLGLPTDLPIECESDNTDENEILGLCSGNFSTAPPDSHSCNTGLTGLFGSQVKKNASLPENKFSGLFDITQRQDTQACMEGVLGFCSGEFSTQKDNSSLDGEKSPTSCSVTSIDSVRTSDILAYCSEKRTLQERRKSPLQEKSPDERRKTPSPTLYMSQNRKTPSPVSPQRKTPSPASRSFSPDLDENKENWPPGFNPELPNAREDETENAVEGDENLLDEVNFEVEEADDEDEDFDEEEHEEMIEWKQFAGGRKKLDKRAFYENEAELSGSDVGSDDEEDLGSEYDEYEKDSGAEEDLPDAEKIKHQINQIHMKKMMDADKHEIRLLQELYLDDGDLGSGEKRQRNFRWRNIDRETVAGGETRLSDDEGDDDGELVNLDVDVQRKKERAERDNFLRDQQESQSEQLTIDDNSQSILNIIKNTSNFTPPVSFRRAQSVIEKPSSQSKSVKRSGSFLSRSKSALNRLSVATAGKNVAGTSSAKSFVFHQKVSDTDKKINRSNSLPEPSPKRVKLQERNNQSQLKSIFSHL